MTAQWSSKPKSCCTEMRRAFQEISTCALQHRETTDYNRGLCSIGYTQDTARNQRQQDTTSRQVVRRLKGALSARPAARGNLVRR